MKVLVVDDEPARAHRARARARARRATTSRLAVDGRAALDHLVEHRVDAVVLDVAMPGLDGLEVCRRLRAAGDRTPVLMLTARDAVDDRVAGLDAGADDYLVKPFALRELKARLRALLRRAEPAAARCCASPTSSSTRRRARSAAAAGRIELSRTEFAAARAVPRAPAPGAHALGDLRARVGLRLRRRRRTRSASTSATCGARPRPAGSRGCSTPCAASATCCARSRA